MSVCVVCRSTMLLHASWQRSYHNNLLSPLQVDTSLPAPVTAVHLTDLFDIYHCLIMTVQSVISLLSNTDRETVLQCYCLSASQWPVVRMLLMHCDEAVAPECHKQSIWAWCTIQTLTRTEHCPAALPGFLSPNCAHTMSDCQHHFLLVCGYLEFHSVLDEMQL